MVPGVGIAPTFTISRAVLSDAVALVRGDRHYTVSLNLSLRFTLRNVQALYNDTQPLLGEALGTPIKPWAYGSPRKSRDQRKRFSCVASASLNVMQLKYHHLTLK
jgi:hypothetical protein